MNSHILDFKLTNPKFENYMRTMKAFQEKFILQILRKNFQYMRGQTPGHPMARNPILQVKKLRALERKELASAAQLGSDRTKAW